MSTAGTKTFAAVDLGASSGRVMTGRVGPDTLHLTQAHRFPNRPVHLPEGLRWDVLGLYGGVLDGLRAAGPVDSLGIDSWAVDYGLLAADGSLLGNPVHYRDRRTEGVPERVWATVPPDALYRATGIQYAPFNTLYQLVAAQGTPQLASARSLLLIPDLIAYWLTGEQGTELTNASTTQLIDPRTGDWNRALADRLGIDLALFAPLRRPGDPAGTLLPAVQERTGLPGPVPVTAVGSHDTASAVAAVPAGRGERFAYLCTGTWSLAGLELDAPVTTGASGAANFTNELGIDGTVRFLRNIMGLWLLQECMRTWELADVTPLLAEAARIPALRYVVDAAAPEFLGARGHARAHRGRLPGGRRTGAPQPRRDHPLRPRLPGPRPPAGDPRGAAPRRPRGRRRPPRRRRRAQRPALPTHRRRLRGARGRGPRRSGRARQRPRPGAGPRPVRRSGLHPRTHRPHPVLDPLRAVG
ncbi:rhamnulokinase [Streptomyces sp. Termitarium-T10T-6]|nr:rhamnulokinase [Streptomyces sp. Termitarium-T10T-6]